MEDVSVGTIATCLKVIAWWTLFILFSKSRIEDLPTYVEDYKYDKTCLSIFVSFKILSLPCTYQGQHIS